MRIDEVGGRGAAGRCKRESGGSKRYSIAFIYTLWFYLAFIQTCPLSASGGLDKNEVRKDRCVGVAILVKTNYACVIL